MEILYLGNKYEIIFMEGNMYKIITGTFSGYYNLGSESFIKLINIQEKVLWGQEIDTYYIKEKNINSIVILKTNKEK